MARLIPSLLGSRTWSETSAQLGPRAKRWWCEAEFWTRQALDFSDWQWAVEADDGTFLASLAVVNDGPGRGWLVFYAGAALTDGAQIAALRHVWWPLLASGAYQSLRAWIECDDRTAIEFASRCGFRYDCGPATAYSPFGTDMDLYLWRREDGGTFRRRRRRESRSARAGADRPQADAAG